MRNLLSGVLTFSPVSLALMLGVAGALAGLPSHDLASRFSTTVPSAPAGAAAETALPTAGEAAA